MTKIIAANWKQNGSLNFYKVDSRYKNPVNRLKKRPKVILFPPSIYLDQFLKKSKRIKLIIKTYSLVFKISLHITMEHILEKYR
ncbi:MAG: hypothetical protein Ct9H90mP18_03070 [Gammaproteobacteria bacterium]|nr:MAG: hypothetical protein Ct9H90mP18_03070 [Gammaproteobacteria bacterium]